ncbi:MAG: hypothetical protein U0136_03525 [Bdellovibrionota bacterium]
MDRDSAKLDLLRPKRVRLRSALTAKNQSAQQIVLEQLEELQQLYETLVQCLDDREAKRAAMCASSIGLTMTDVQTPRSIRQRLRHAESCLKLAEFLADEIRQLLDDTHCLEKKRSQLVDGMRDLKGEARLLEQEERRSRAAMRSLTEVLDQNDTEERPNAGRRA